MNKISQIPTSSVHEKAIFPLLVISFIDMLGFSIVLPFMVVIVLKLGGNAVVYGLLGSAYSFFQLIGAPVLGNWSDRIGRRKVLLFCEAGTFMGCLIFLAGLLIPGAHPPHEGDLSNDVIFSIPLFLIFLARAIDGLTGGSISVANAYVADISTNTDRKANFGKLAAAGNLGLIIGPVIAGLTGSTFMGNILPVLFAAGISLSAIWVVYKYLPENKVFINKKENNLDTKKHSLPLIFKIPGVPYFLLLYFLIFLAFNFFYIAFPVYAADSLHWSVLKLGVFFSFLSGVLVIVQSLLLPYLSRKFSGGFLVVSGSLILAAGFVLLKFDDLLLMYTGAFLFALGNGIMWPSFLALLSTTGNDHSQGSIQGLASSAGSFASIIGLISGAFLFNYFHERIFVIIAAFVVFIAVLSIPLIRMEKEN